MITPKTTANIIRTMFIIPSVLNDSLIKIVEIINPEFLITLLNLSECKKENNSKRTSTSINIVKKSSKNTVLISLISVTILVTEKKLSYNQCPRL
jgi:hypothetical protein